MPKLKLDDLFNQLNKTDYRLAMNYLPSALSIGRRTIYRWRANESALAKAPIGKLIDLCIFFGCVYDVPLLLEYTSKIETLEKIKEKESERLAEKALASKHGLQKPKVRQKLEV